MLTGVAPSPLLVETSGLELKRLLDLLPRIEVMGGLPRIRSREDPGTKRQVVRPRMLREPVAWETCATAAAENGEQARGTVVQSWAAGSAENQTLLEGPES